MGYQMTGKSVSDGVTSDFIRAPERESGVLENALISLAQSPVDLSYAPGVQSRPITESQLNVLRVVHDYIVDNGYAPTMREIGQRLGIASSNGVSWHLRALASRGLLKRGDRCARGVSLTSSGLRALGVARPEAVDRSPAPSRPRSGPEWVRGSVYFIEAVGCGRVKIGFTKRNLEARCLQLQTGSPFPLRVLAATRGSAADETGLHARFREYRVSMQTEWVHAGSRLIAHLATLGVALSEPE